MSNTKCCWFCAETHHFEHCMSEKLLVGAERLLDIHVQVILTKLPYDDCKELFVQRVSTEFKLPILKALVLKSCPGFLYITLKKDLIRALFQIYLQKSNEINIEQLTDRRTLVTRWLGCTIMLQIRPMVHHDVSECPICYEETTTHNCSTLNCGHTFCSDCVQLIIKTNTTPMCAVCRNQINLVYVCNTNTNVETTNSVILL